MQAAVFIYQNCRILLILKFQFPLPKVYIYKNLTILFEFSIQMIMIYLAFIQGPQYSIYFIIACI